MPLEEWKLTGKWADPESDTCSNGYFDELSGAPTARLFSNAVQVWALCQERTVTVQEAATAFNVPSARIYEAVEEHGWMFIGGTGDNPSVDVIEHEGE